jgi:hypothetical protein
MTEESRELSHALFAQERAYIKEHLGDESWIKVYDYSRNAQDTKIFNSGLLPNECVNEALQNTDWEVDIGHGFPECVRFGDGTVEYSRFGIADAEPLVFIRDYVGFRESHAEISEEFRFFHNLYHESRKNEFLKFDESGEEETIIRFQNETILIRLREIRQFLAIREAHLALFFDYVHYSNLDISNVPEDERRGKYNDERTIYEFGVTEAFSHSNYNTVSYLRGKKLISPYPKSKVDSGLTLKMKRKYMRNSR